LNGDKETGVTVILLDEEMDHGPVLARREFSISNFQFSNHDELAKKLFELGAELLVETLPKYVSGEIKPKAQNHSQATFTKMFTREDGRINWSDSPEKIYNQIRALNPEPGTWSVWHPSTSSGQADKIINIKKVELHDGKLQIQVIQMEGKKEMSFKDFLNGHPDFDISQLK